MANFNTNWVEFFSKSASNDTALVFGNGWKYRDIEIKLKSN